MIKLKRAFVYEKEPTIEPRELAEGEMLESVDLKDIGPVAPRKRDDIILLEEESSWSTYRSFLSKEGFKHMESKSEMGEVVVVDDANIEIINMVLNNPNKFKLSVEVL